MQFKGLEAVAAAAAGAAGMAAAAAASLCVDLSYPKKRGIRCLLFLLSLHDQHKERGGRDRGDLFRSTGTFSDLLKRLLFSLINIVFLHLMLCFLLLLLSVSSTILRVSPP